MAGCMHGGTWGLPVYGPGGAPSTGRARPRQAEPAGSLMLGSVQAPSFCRRAWAAKLPTCMGSGLCQHSKDSTAFDAQAARPGAAGNWQSVPASPRSSLAWCLVLRSTICGYPISYAIFFILLHSCGRAAGSWLPPCLCLLTAALGTWACFRQARVGWHVHPRLCWLACLRAVTLSLRSVPPIMCSVQQGASIIFRAQVVQRGCTPPRCGCGVAARRVQGQHCLGGGSAGRQALPAPAVALAVPQVGCCAPACSRGRPWMRGWNGLLGCCSLGGLASCVTWLTPYGYRM
jgi:hypothetical protein